MSGTYDPTNLRDDRHPLRALGMAFGQRQAMDQAYEGAQPQYQGTPLAAQLTARSSPMMGSAAPAANPMLGAIASGLSEAMRRQSGQGGASPGASLYDWLQPARQEMAMPAASMPKGEW